MFYEKKGFNTPAKVSTSQNVQVDLDRKLLLQVSFPYVKRTVYLLHKLFRIQH